jgi:hypothetical protein
LAVVEKTRRGVDRRLSTWVAIGSALIVLAGFARTYYLKGLFGTPALSGLLHVHGIVMTLWIALFVAQVRLVAARRVRLHRRLGAAGAVLAALVLVFGVMTAIYAARRGGEVPPGSPPPLEFLAVPLGDMVIFAALVATGLALRRRVDVHRRLMLLSCVNFLTPAIARIPLEFIANGGPLVFFGLTDLFLLACVAVDTVKNRRLHPAFGWGALLVVASQPLRLMIAGTDAWMRFATWLVG